MWYNIYFFSLFYQIQNDQLAATYLALGDDAHVMFVKVFICGAQVDAMHSIEMLHTSE